MKITKKELSQIIKEEAQRFITIKKLEAEKAEIERQLNESYMEEMGTMEEEMEEAFLGIKSKEEKAEQKAKLEKLSQEAMKKLDEFEKTYGVDKLRYQDYGGGKIEKWNKGDVFTLLKKNKFLGTVQPLQDPRNGNIVIMFREGNTPFWQAIADLASAAGGEAKIQKEELSESVIRKMIKEESEKMEKAKELKAKAEEIKNQLKNL